MTYIFFEEAFGNRLENGTWTGLLGAIQNKKIDFGMAVFLQNSRREIADFLRVVYTEK